MELQGRGTAHRPPPSRLRSLPQRRGRVQGSRWRLCELALEDDEAVERHLELGGPPRRRLRVVEHAYEAHSEQGRQMRTSAPPACAGPCQGAGAGRGVSQALEAGKGAGGSSGAPESPTEGVERRVVAPLGALVPDRSPVLQRPRLRGSRHVAQVRRSARIPPQPPAPPRPNGSAETCQGRPGCAPLGVVEGDGVDAQVEGVAPRAPRTRGAGSGPAAGGRHLESPAARAPPASAPPPSLLPWAPHERRVGGLHEPHRGAAAAPPQEEEARGRSRSAARSPPRRARGRGAAG